MTEEKEKRDDSITSSHDETEKINVEEVTSSEEILEEEKEQVQVSEEEPEDTKEDELNIKIQALEDRNLRLQAEIANMQRSNARERQDAAKYRSQSLANKLIDAIDNLERALQIEANSEESQAIHKGIQMVYDQVLQAFKEENIEVINPLNESFDPNYHQAVTTQPVSEGQEVDIVVNVLQKGYLLNDRIIRPAMVIVSA
ncbi:nucleotide exchange factor GrpE [Facklamia miroungae]|uniref:Protein GrpE n=1 Tax=Facklamia miroungae TaxID=120956 RepID=A0A1G7P4K6_9LACT|nr:nucleotide exchange factor GrpE [Facklamia miroungae]NKZ28579.1 nucleotide exchange factor GrpE [Facklamia miroungae]SDF81238.1 molecular chaperone GrpE [Facklamia miroungae]